MAIINDIKTVSDNSFGLVNLGTRSVIEFMSMQLTNIFDLIVYPAHMDPLSLIGLKHLH